MSITKILHINSEPNNVKGRHLKDSINYICNADKTESGVLVGFHNCTMGFAYDQMQQTKAYWGKTDGRQGYHIIISFQEGEATPETAMKVIEQFVKEYLGDRFEAVYSVHDNTNHVHGHIVFNSVSCLDGKKFHYANGDWARQIQPMVNRICSQYGLATLKIEDHPAPKSERPEYGDHIFSPMIRRDIDAAIVLSSTFESFVDKLRDMEYEVKTDVKYIAVRPPGMKRFKRLKSLGDNYTEERIRERILTESPKDLKTERPRLAPKARVIKCSKRITRRMPKGIQSYYIGRAFRASRMRRGGYSQAWRYKDDILRMKSLQKKYLILCKYGAESVRKLIKSREGIDTEIKSVQKEKRQIQKERIQYVELFKAAEKVEALKECENAYHQGDLFFEDEHIEYQKNVEILSKSHISKEDLEKLRVHYKTSMSSLIKKEKELRRDRHLVDEILRELEQYKPSGTSKDEKEKTQDKRLIKSRPR